MPLSAQQRQVVKSILEWLSAADRPYLTLGGYAGTGKTTVIAAVRFLLAQQRPQWRVAFAAYTGKATQVLAQKLRRIPVDLSADSISTLHALLYTPIMDNQGQIAGWQRRREIPYDLIVIDEASMLSREIWQDVSRARVPILAVGDHGQLPPIDDDFSLMISPDLTLDEIHRQAAASPIIQVATLARTTGQIPVADYGPGVRKIDRCQSDAQLMMEDLFQQYQTHTLFLTGFNHSRQGINQAIRAAKLRDSTRPEPGEKVICLRNNWQKNIYNGLTGVLSSIQSVSRQPESYEISVQNETGELLYQGLASQEQFGAAKTLLWNKTQRARSGELWDFGYALTVHKAQGSQAERVIVMEERSQHMDDAQWARWLYTAVTRAEKELIIFGVDR